MLSTSLKHTKQILLIEARKAGPPVLPVPIEARKAAPPVLAAHASVNAIHRQALKDARSKQKSGELPQQAYFGRHRTAGEEGYNSQTRNRERQGHDRAKNRSKVLYARYLVLPRTLIRQNCFRVHSHHEKVLQH